MKNELNKLYNLFLSRHPTFREHGSVSIIAHSLGSVIVYDILERWDLRLRDIEVSSHNRFVTDSINYLNSMEENLSSASGQPGDSKENPIHVELAQAQLRLEELDYKLHNQASGLSNGQKCKDALEFKVGEIATRKTITTDFKSLVESLRRSKGGSNLIPAILTTLSFTTL